MPGRDTRWTLLPTMVLVILSGAVALRYGGLLEWAQYLAPSYWAHNAMAAAVDLNVLTAATVPEH